MDDGKPTLDLIAAAKAVVERDVRLGIVEEERIRDWFVEKQHLEGYARALSKTGLSNREIAKRANWSPRTINRLLGEANASESEANASPATDKPVGFRSSRELTGQSNQNDWRTPRRFLDAAREVMGGIDLDPASSAEANETVKAAQFYTEEEDGLKLPWKGTVWLNPPYGGNARLFVDRLLREFQVGNVTAACALLNAHGTETKWFQALFDYTVCFIAGRIEFGGPSREVASSNTCGSAVVYLGDDLERFTKLFSEFGSVVRKLRD